MNIPDVCVVVVVAMMVFGTVAAIYCHNFALVCALLPLTLFAVNQLAKDFRGE